ncbi:MAG: hypothetical protein ABGY96_23345 [bacterium]|nr:hypothetical protein [Gammaproteobacteria bacterium]HIL98417.1 hypothetical protein [Pseudomonadales bacterium]
MPVQAVTPQRIREIKRQAKQLSRSTSDKTYMQCLDIVCRQEMGLRHYHEAQKLVGKAPRTSVRELAVSPWTLYLQACQDAYFEL